MSITILYFSIILVIVVFRYFTIRLNERRIEDEQEATRIAKEKAYLKAKRTARKAAEEKRIRIAEAKKDLERNSYYYLETKDGNSVLKGPIDLQKMLKLFKSGKISFRSRVKFGLESELKPLKEFKELTEGLDGFL